MKKPCAAPLDGFGFVIDEGMGRGVPRRLKRLGVDVIYGPDVLRQGASDAEVFGYAGRHGRALLAKDHYTKDRERPAIAAFGLAVFQIARGNLSSDEMVRAFVAAGASILRHLQSQPRPFIVRLNRSGGTTRVIAARELRTLRP